MLDYLFFIIISLVLTLWWRSKPFIWMNAGIPYSVPLPFFGSMAPALFTRLGVFFENMYNKIGPNDKCYGFHFFGGMPALILKDPELIKKVTINYSDHFMDRGFHTEESYDPMSRGLFFSNGEQWKTYRSKMTPYFTPARLKGMLPLIQPTSEKFRDYILKEGKMGPVDVHAASMKLAVDTVTTTIFGLEPDAFDNPNSFFFGLQREFLSFKFNLKTFFGILSPKLYGVFGFTIFSAKTTRTMNKFVADVVEQRIKGVGNRPDFLQGMVELHLKEDKDDHDIKYNKDGTRVARFDMIGVSGQCFMMYAAGTETTGNTMTFLLYELAKHPAIQQKARDEINTMIKRTNNQFGLDDLQGLHYINMVIKETLRKYPIVVIYSRKCTKTLQLEELTIPAGTMIIIANMGIHHDPIYYPEPEKFDPERFADDNIDAGTYSPFGLGPRTCIGMKLALTEIVLSLCKLLPKCKLTTSHKNKDPVEYSFNPTLSPANGLWLNVEEIE